MTLTDRLKVRSLKSQLTFWFGGIALAVLIASGYYLYQIAAKELVALQGQSLHARAEAAAVQLSNQIKEREIEVQVLSQNPVLVRADWSNPFVAESVEVRRRNRPEYAWLGVMDAAGTVRYATDGFLLGADLSGRTWFQAGRNGLFVGDVHEAVLLAKLVKYEVLDGEVMRFIDVAAPIWKEGRLQGVAAAHIHWDWVWHIALQNLSDHGLGPNLEMLIFDANGEVLYPHRRSGLVLPELEASDTAFALKEWVGDGVFLTSVVPVPPTASTQLGWKLVLRQPQADAFDEVAELRNSLLGLGLVVMAMVLWAAYRTARHMASPLEQITLAAQQIESGERDVHFPADQDILEVEQLTRSLESMTRKLRAHETELEEQVRVRTIELEQAIILLEKLSSVDALTGVFNRRRLEERLKEWLLLYKRTQHPFCLLMLDIDHFKSVNDTFGHDTGDAVLQAFAQVLTASVRNTDMVARFGGEEFVVVLPDTSDLTLAASVAEKIREAVSQTTFPIPRPVTASIGVSICQPDDESFSAVLKRADMALYEAKGAGRNRVMVSGAER